MGGDGARVDCHAEVGFGRASAAYERGRPDYPEAAVARGCEGAGLGSDGTALDLGAGTGKFTRLLKGRAARVIAVEPVDAMRAELVARSPDVEALAGAADAIPLGDASVDAVFCAQAFHWFATAQVLREIRRVLRDGGGLALVWNSRDQRVPWVAELTALLDRYAGTAPRHRSHAWRVPFDETSPFTPLETHVFDYAQPIASIDALVDRIASISFVAAADEPTRAEILDATRAIGLREQVTSFPYRTEVHTCRCRGR